MTTDDNEPYVDGCVIGTETDKFEAFTVELVQDIISKEEDDMLIFMEEFDEDATDHVEEEEIESPMNFFSSIRRRLSTLGFRLSGGPADPKGALFEPMADPKGALFEPMIESSDVTT